jgi:hypothetical protein
MDSRFDRAIASIDAFNARDPHGEELLYSQRMTAWLARLEPDASEALRLAVRAQHIGRWTSPRKTYPDTRAGYKQWRDALAGYHAEKATEILREAGYGDDVIARVAALIKKKNLKTDAESQTLEDVACLVFLDHEFADFAERHGDEKLIRILQRTWLKMSERGREAALGLDFPPRLKGLIEAALAPRA